MRLFSQAIILKEIYYNTMSIKTNIADYLAQVEKLTATNLQILKTINDSFFTKKNHLFAEIDNTTYVIPSFISLENKINRLQENFENLVKSPETCEAYFNFDGNTRAIEVRKYSHVPDNITLPVVNSYYTENNDIFKDFLTPVPYINLTLPTLPNDTVEVNVKKIVAKSDKLKALFKNKLAYTVEEQENNNTVLKTYYHQSCNAPYGDIYKLLLNYKEDYDYVEYDTVHKLPIIKNIGTGTYVIEKVVSDIVNDDLEEIITLKLRNDLTDAAFSNNLTYKIFDDTIEKPLQVGDELINFNGTGKVVIKSIKPAINTIEVKVVNGEYLNFLGTESYDTNNDIDIHDLSKLRFYASIDFNENKNIKVPLEEDQYIFIAVAVLNSKMNMQSSWGIGTVIDTYSLTNSDINKTFKTYYDNNVKNIGDILFEMSTMITSPITTLSQDEFQHLTSLKPVFNPKSVSVMQINKHLNNSSTVKNIRNAYNQKKTAETKLNEIQHKINSINDKLASISFNDTTGIRSTYAAQLTQFNREKNELLTSINNAINTISLNVNNSELPIENAKYRIRGFFVPDASILNNVIGIQVQYRYKNIYSESGNAVSITSPAGDKTYIYSDWNVFSTTNKLKKAQCSDGIYSYKYEDNNENINEPSYNQIDIPISQGESVDIRVKVVYDYGQPYITMTSDWSEIINVSFPEEFTKDVPVLTIIEENNNDIETNRFNNILETAGINSHINDTFMDQNITYFHKPDNIASGFYTDERKVIPLKDKLLDIVNDIAALKSDILGADTKCLVNLAVGNTGNELYSDRDNNITLEPYNNFTEGTDTDDVTIDGSYKIINIGNDKQAYKVSTILNLSIANVGDSILKLFPIFPGKRDTIINNTNSNKKSDYCIGNNEGVYFTYLNAPTDASKLLQTQNQFLTFRINDVWTDASYYSSNSNASTDVIQSSKTLPAITDITKNSMVIYPCLNTKHGLCIDSDSQRSYLVINPGEEVVVPLYCEYIVPVTNGSIKKTISFDLRTSLYNDPINYSVTIIAKNTASTQDYLMIKNKKMLIDRLGLPILQKYSQTIK